jgi:hypothetical protein
MLGKLHAIDWHGLEAEDLPKWIISLTSKDSRERFQASVKLLDYFCQHSAALNLLGDYKDLLSTDAPVLATPFFIELLSLPETRNKERILEILSVLASYPTIPLLEQIHLERASKIYEILLQSFDLYVPFLDSDESDTRIHTMYLLWYFVEKSAFVTDRLLDRLETNDVPDSFGKAVAAERIFAELQRESELTKQFSSRYARILRGWLSDWSETISVQATAAFYLIRLEGEKVEPFVVRILSNVLKLPSYHTLHIPLLDDCIDAFMQLGIERGTDALLDVFDAQTTFLLIYDLAGALLGIHFGAEDYRRVHASPDYYKEEIVRVVVETTIQPVQQPLNEVQKKILRHIWSKDEMWKLEPNKLLDVFSLPNSRASLKLFIA